MRGGSNPTNTENKNHVCLLIFFGFLFSNKIAQVKIWIIFYFKLSFKLYYGT